MGPLILYAALALIVALYGRSAGHGFWRLWALAFTFTPWLTFLYLLYLERKLGRS
jgi:hypothetical protein